jgi:uncharacterized protein
MIIELDRLEKGNEKFDLLIKPEDVDLEREDVEIKGDISLRGEAERHIAQTDIKGVIAFAADVECTRCLKPVPSSFLFDFEVSYVTPENFSGEREKELLESELATDVSESGRIDLNDVVREQILLNLPEQTLCKDECKGICPECGVDRNIEDCNCAGDDIDPRWSALKDLK